MAKRYAAPTKRHKPKASSRWNGSKREARPWHSKQAGGRQYRGGARS